MARTQLHSPKAALDTFLIFLGWKSGLFRYGLSLLMMAGATLSLSKFRRESRKPMSFSIPTLVTHQSTFICPLLGSFNLDGPSPFKMQTASITSLTGAGGLFMPLTSLMSFFVSVSSALIASFSMGSASCRSLSHSSLMACTLLASSLAFASSALTTIFTLSASTVSLAIVSISVSVSLLLISSCGFRAVSSSCISDTCAAVESSFSRPIS
mmetsp:Transcript_27172/g.68361  ORF Transcript_27172/g.68361 Transcript_27172/m.68361 type:complete len:211 (+) Transcript_27172:2443-3075(+)